MAPSQPSTFPRKRAPAPVVRRAPATVDREQLTHKTIAGAEEEELIRRYQQGDRAAGERLLRAHAALIMSIAKVWARRGGDIEDLIQEGRIGFLLGVEKFDFSKGVKLTTYVVWWVRHQIRSHTVRTRSVIYIPEHVQFGHVEVTNQTALDARNAFRPLSLNSTPASHDRGDFLIDRLVSDASLPELVEDQIDNGDRAKLAEAFLATLTPRELAVVTARIMSDEPKTLEQLGDSFGVTRERVRQIEAKALLKMRRACIWLAPKRRTP